MHKTGDDVAIRPADLHLRAGPQHQKAFAICVRLDLPHLVQIDDRRTVDPLERSRVEPLFQILHCFAQDQRVVGRVNAHIVASSINTFNAFNIDTENLAAILNIDKLFKAL